MRGGQQYRILAAAVASDAPWSQSVEDAAVQAWRALDSFTGLSAAELRQERRALLEMADMVKRAMRAIEGGDDD